MFLERNDPNRARAFICSGAGEKVRPEDPVSSPLVEERVTLSRANMWWRLPAWYG